MRAAPRRPDHPVSLANISPHGKQTPMTHRRPSDRRTRRTDHRCDRVHPQHRPDLFWWKLLGAFLLQTVLEVIHSFRD
jgi:hypothetical protein